MPGPAWRGDKQKPLESDRLPKEFELTDLGSIGLLIDQLRNPGRRVPANIGPTERPERWNKSDRLDLKKANDPNQTAFPRIEMDSTTAAPVSKTKKPIKPPAAKKKAKKKAETSPAEGMARWITSVTD